MNMVAIKSATPEGYEVAKVGDGLNIKNINSKTRRGRVGDQRSPTIEAYNNLCTVVGYTRDAKGQVVKRHEKDEAGTLHSASGGGGNTDQFVKQYEYKKANETVEQNPEDFKEGVPKALDFHNRKTQDISPCLFEPHHNAGGLFDGYRIRRLTPIECERLQGFPDNHTAIGNYDGKEKPVSNTQRYKQCGNAVTVDVVAALAEKIKPLFE